MHVGIDDTRARLRIAARRRVKALLRFVGEAWLIDVQNYSAARMISPTSQSSLAANYALRALTEIASRLKTDGGQSPASSTISSAAPSGTLQNAAARITQILLDAQNTLPVIRTPTVTVDPTPPEERTSGPRVVGADGVFITGDRYGNRSITTMGQYGSVTTRTAPLRGSESERYSMIFVNDRPTTITLNSDVDVGLVVGSADDEFLAVASRGSVFNVLAVDGGDGDDLVVVTADRAKQIRGGEGDDFVHVRILGTGSASEVDGGDGDDTIHITRSIGIVSDVTGGDGDDTMYIEAGTARNISGGDGNDRMYVGGANVERISGGRGDDTISIGTTNGSVATLVFNEGDGHDTVEAHGPVRIERYNADGSAQALDLASVTVTRGERGEFIIDFGNGTDSLTIRRNDVGFQPLAVTATDDGALLI
jgi:hypothetical protein